MDKKVCILFHSLNSFIFQQLRDLVFFSFGRGDYRLRPSHEQFRISSEAWSEMSETQRIKKVMQCFVLDPKTKTVKSTNGKLTVVGPAAAAGQKLNQRKRKRTAKTTTRNKLAKK